MEGLQFRKLNKYQTEVRSENHRVVLTDMIMKYTYFLKRAKINAILSAILGFSASIFACTVIQRILSSFSHSDTLILVAAGCIVIIAIGVFNSSRYDVKKYSGMLDHYNKI